MEKLSLDAEPPSKFRGEKEVNKKKNGNLHQLILSLKGEKNRNRNINSRKNLEKQVRLNWQDYVFDIDYLKNNNSLVEETLTSRTNVVIFTSALDRNKNQVISQFNYSQNRNNTGIRERKLLTSYEINSPYSFTPQIKEEEKKEDLSTQSKEQETKEASYILHNFEEETKQEI